MGRPIIILTLVLAAVACDERVEGVTPVGGDRPSIVELERFARRLHLDLSGVAPDQATVSAAAERLLAAGNTAEARAALADELLSDRRFAELYVDELDNRAFGGQTLESHYDFVCAIIRGNDLACRTCAPPAGGDPCADCSCPLLASLRAERAELRQSAAELHAGAATGTIERRYAAGDGFRFLFGDPAQLANALFEVFLGRPAEGEELRNGRNIAIGALVPNTQAGLLFHRHGASYADLVDIVFTSEIYREAAVAHTFARYLGRPPSGAELAYFTADLDAAEPDLRAVVRAVVSSREYFEQ